MNNFIKPLLALKTKSGYSIFSVLIVVVFSVWGISDALKAEVTYAADGNSQTIKSSNDTVGDLLEDLEIDVTKEDLLSHEVDEILEDGMKIEHIKAKEITVIIDGDEKTYHSTADNVETFFKEENLDFSKEDDVSQAPSTKVKEGLVINVTKAFEVPVNYAGEKETVWTTGGSVEEILSEHDFEVKAADKVKPAKEEQIEAGSSIKVTEVTEKTVTEKESINFKTKEKEDDKLEKGTEKVVQKGKKGSLEKTYNIVLENGKEVEKTEIDKKVLSEAKEEVLAIGTKVTPKETENNKSTSEPSGGQTKTMEATAYTAECTGCSGITATGINLSSNPNKKVVAVDPSVIPLGSKVWVSGYGEAIAGDTGGDIKGNRIDLHFPNKQAAYSFGRQAVTVKVIN